MEKFLCAATCFSIFVQKQSGMLPSLLSKIDHLVYAVPDFEAGLDFVENLLGIRPGMGGQHPAFGTQNALLSLGEACYLEIIGPDPSLGTPARPRPFGIDRLTAPKLVTWAAKASGLEAWVKKARENGLPVGNIATGQRLRPDGTLLAWQLTDLYVLIEGGIIPFLIDWGDSQHPAKAATPGIRLLDLRAEHPQPEAVKNMLQLLDIEMQVDAGEGPSLVATLETPKGLVVL